VLGTLLAPGVGTVVGGLLGGFIGGLVGGWLGAQVDAATGGALNTSLNAVPGLAGAITAASYLPLTPGGFESDLERLSLRTGGNLLEDGERLAAKELGAGERGLVQEGSAAERNTGRAGGNSVRGGGTPRPAMVGADDLPVYEVSRSRTPAIAANTEAAWREGYPEVLTYRGAGAPSRRGWYRSRGPAGPGLWWDEYPYDSVVEGGPGSRLQPVPISEQLQQSQDLRRFYRSNNLSENDRFRVRVVDRSI
jgi:hypothetical protein